MLALAVELLRLFAPRNRPLDDQLDVPVGGRLHLLAVDASGRSEGHPRARSRTAEANRIEPAMMLRTMCLLERNFPNA